MTGETSDTAPDETSDDTETKDDTEASGGDETGDDDKTNDDDETNDDVETWTDEQDAEYAETVLEQYMEGAPEFSIEEKAAASLNETDG